jgi:hypothetical protein
MANIHEQAPGVHGYSGPADELAIFELPGPSRDWTQVEAARHITEWTGAAPILARGCWLGKESPAFILPLPAFREIQRRVPGVLATEDCVLILGRPEARNWRPARLEWLRGDKAGSVQKIGTWHSVTEVEARARDGWTYVPSLSAWFIVSDNPAPSVSARDLASVPRDPMPDFPVTGGPPMPHDYSREPGGAALHRGAAEYARRVAGMCEAQGDLVSALWWTRRACQHLALAHDSAQYWAGVDVRVHHAEARDATEALHKARAELYDTRQRATIWELIAKASACTVGRREFVRPRLDQESITWGEAEAALSLIMARREGSDQCKMR